MRAKRVVIQEPVTSDVEDNGKSQDKVQDMILKDTLLKFKSAVKIPKLDLRQMLDWDHQAHQFHSNIYEKSTSPTRLQQSLDTIRERVVRHLIVRRKLKT